MPYLNQMKEKIKNISLKQDIKDEIKDKIKKINEIQEFKNEGIKIRTKNPTVKSIYKTGKILDKKKRRN